MSKDKENLIRSFISNGWNEFGHSSTYKNRISEISGDLVVVFDNGERDPILGRIYQKKNAPDVYMIVNSLGSGYFRYSNIEALLVSDESLEKYALRS